MARIRALKIGFFKDEDLAALSFAHRLLFEGLWCLADREGRLEDRPKRIKAELFPYDDPLDVSAMLQDLARGDDPFIVRYVVDGKGYLWVRKFARHQRPHHTEPPSEYPPPPQRLASTPDMLPTKSVRPPIQDAEVLEPHGVNPLGNGEWVMGNEEGNGEGAPAPPPADAPLWIPPSQKVEPLFSGREAREHGEHIFCGRVCVRWGLHAEFVRRLAGTQQDRRLREWYPTVFAKHEGKDIGDDAFTFWRNEFAAWVGTVSAKPIQRSADTRGLIAHDVFERAGAALEEVHDRQRHGTETPERRPQVAGHRPPSED